MADILKATEDVTIWDSDGSNSVLVSNGQLWTLPKTDRENYIKDKKGFVYTTGPITVSGTSETDFVLLKNPNGSGVSAKFCQIYMATVLALGNYSTFRTYRNPTITTNGTAGTINPIDSSGSASALSVYTAPTISARGTLITSYMVLATQINIMLDYLFILNANENKLITIQAGANNKDHQVLLRWVEV